MSNEIKTDIVFKEIKDSDNKTEDTPQSLNSWLNLGWSDEKLAPIIDNILTEIEKIEEERKPRYEKIKQFRNQYNQIVQETSLPFAGAFNVCVPLTPKNMDACVSQTKEAFEDVDPK